MTENDPASEPTPAQIRDAIDRILGSGVFALSNRQKAFLSFIVNAALEGQAGRLKEYTLATEVFDKDESFDPSIDSLVRVEASRLRSKLREYYDSEGQDDLVRIDIPKGRYAPAFRFINRNLTPAKSEKEPEKESEQEHEVDRASSINEVSGSKFRFIVIGLLAAIILYLGIDNYVLEQDRPAPVKAPDKVVEDRSVAVLPFLAMSSGEDDGYFADGLTEEILNSLARMPELRVTARTSSFFFKGKNLLVPEIASRLGVAHVVEGSVRRDKDRLRIAVQVIRASDDVHLWSQSYDRSRGDVFGVQEEIAERIAEVLGVVLDDTVREVMHNTDIHDIEAFIAYQKGQEAFFKAHQGMNISEALAIANTNFDTALETAPRLTTARLMKADLRGHVLFEITTGIRRQNYPGELRETVAALREEYRLAVELSPAGNQRDILDLEKTLFSEEWAVLPARIGKAMQSGGCAQMSWTNAFISPFGWGGQLSTKFRELVTCDPLDTIAYFQLASSLIWSGDPGAALQVIAEAEEKGLRHPFLDDSRYWAILASERLDDPQARGPGPAGGNMPYDRQILREALMGNATVATQMANDYWSGPDANDFSSLVIAAAIGDRAKANEAVARIDTHPGSVVAISSAIFTCFCGAPFDLDAAPNFKARINEARISWPPLTRINYPTKNW